jgi:hypothetical protein
MTIVLPLGGDGRNCLIDFSGNAAATAVSKS